MLWLWCPSVDFAVVSELFQACLPFLSNSIADQDVENIQAYISDRNTPSHCGLAHKVE